MAKKKKQKTIKYKGYNCKPINKWTAPEHGGAPLLTMPNIPHPMHNMAPRTILGSSTWNHMRNRCYFESGYTCEICGEKVATEFYENGAVKHKYHDDGTLPKRSLHAHELYNIDYDKGTMEFVRAVAICECAHVRFIHSGRMLTLYKKGDPLMPAEKVLEGLEHGFKQIYEWNKEHYGEEKLRAFYAIIDFAEDETIGEQVKALIDKYEIEFYIPCGEKMHKDVPVWNDWKLIIGEKEYASPYKDRADWEAKMAKNNEEQIAKNRSWAARIKTYTDSSSVKITDDDMDKINSAEIPDGF